MTRNGRKNSNSIDVMETAKARKSTLLVGTVFAALAAWNIHRGRITLAEWLGGAGVVLLIVGAFLPAAARRFYKVWMMVGAALGFVNSRIVLSVFYYLIVTPCGCFSRLAGRDPLKRRKSKLETYWVSRSTTRQTTEGFERAF